MKQLTNFSVKKVLKQNNKLKSKRPAEIKRFRRSANHPMQDDSSWPYSPQSVVYPYTFTLEFTTLLEIHKGHQSLIRLFLLRLCLDERATTLLPCDLKTIWLTSFIDF